MGWRRTLLGALGIGFAADSVLACFLHGLLYFLPIYLVTLMVGGIWEVLFAAVRNHEVNEGFLVTSLLFGLTLPADHSTVAGGARRVVRRRCSARRCSAAPARTSSTRP